ncbi:MAG: UPF0179 family protein [Candidatus Odinarchaeota archaeon]
MAIITLLSVEQAKIGHKFIFYSELPECSECKLKKTCSDNLVKGRLYEVVRILSKKHPCKILETEMAVVEVKYSLIEALIEARTVFEGAIILFKPVEETVPEELEKYREPPGLKQGDKCKIIQVIDHPATLKKNFKICQLELLSPNSGK